MRREVTDCDRCSAKEIVPVSVRLKVGKSANPAGGPWEADFAAFDLCQNCAAWAFNVVADELDYPVAKELAAKIANKVKRP